MAMIEPISNTTGLPMSSDLQSEKIVILSSTESDSATFSIKDEDHTLGNSLRYMIMKKYAFDHDSCVVLQSLFVDILSHIRQSTRFTFEFKPMVNLAKY